MKTYHTKAWNCETCGYTQDFDPQLDLHVQVHRVQKGKCPVRACVGELVSTKTITMRVAEAIDFGKVEHEVLDETKSTDGNPVYKREKLKVKEVSAKITESTAKIAELDNADWATEAQ